MLGAPFNVHLPCLYCTNWKLVDEVSEAFQLSLAFTSFGFEVFVDYTESNSVPSGTTKTLEKEFDEHVQRSRGMREIEMAAPSSCGRHPNSL